MKCSAMTMCVRLTVCFAACFILLTGLPGAAMGVPSATPAQARVHTAPAWLAEINRYRLAADLTPVVDQPAWDIGLQHHLRYLALTPKRYFTGQYQSLHTENPSSPDYTQDGAKEARSSDLLEGIFHSTAVEVIDVWLRAPFHATGMLRPDLRQVALAYDPSTGAGALDVIGGLVYSMSAPTKPALFPGPGVTTNLTTFSGEVPNPLETCGWSAFGTYGLPFIALLTQSPSLSLRASLSGPGGLHETSGAKNLCIVDDITYHSSDPVYGPTGKQILTADHAVYLLPRLPLRTGAYQVSIVQPKQAGITWTFQVRAAAPGA